MAGKRVQRICLILNIFFAIGYLLVCLVPFLRSGNFWFIAMLGLVFPWLCAFILLFLIISLFLRDKKGIIINIIVLLLGFQQILAVAAFRLPHTFSESRQEKTLRVLSWNVSRWVEGNQKDQGATGYRKMMLDFVGLQDADVLCFQEFFESYDAGMAAPTIPMLVKMGYPYHYFFPSSKIYESKYQFGTAIFSRFPILDSGQFITSEHPHSEGYCFADINWQGRKIRVFSTHLESFGLRSGEPGGPDGGYGLTGKMKYSYDLRNYQAVLLADAIHTSPYHSIVTGDLDDVPNSFAYFRVRGDMKDVFLRAGSGFGGTISLNGFLPAPRIDYIFTDPVFKTLQFKKLVSPFSDHQALLADLQISGD